MLNPSQTVGERLKHLLRDRKETLTKKETPMKNFTLSPALVGVPTALAMATAALAGCAGDRDMAATGPEGDVVGQLIEVALKAHEEATGKTRPDGVLLEPWGLDDGEIPGEVADEVRRRIESGSGVRSVGRHAGEPPAGWALRFRGDRDLPDIVFVEVREAGARVWPMYGVSATRDSDGLVVGDVVARGEVLSGALAVFVADR